MPKPATTANNNAADLIAAIERHNAGRDPQLLARKYGKMAHSPFLFLRGADHLFYDALPDTPLFNLAPPAWCCGDLHVENFGSYKGDNRQVYFDINDFDEGALAPANWDLVRLLASILCGARELHLTADSAQTVSRACLDAYRGALAAGKPLWVERETSTGLVKDLLAGLQKRERAAFLDKRTKRDGKQRRLKLDEDKALAPLDGQRQMVTAFVDSFAAGQPEPGFYRVLDVARRVAGTGSLGLMRFVVLVEGKGSPDRNYLLDIKESRPSSLLARLARCGIAQPSAPNEAGRIVAIQKRMQAVDHAFLHAQQLNGAWCTVKGLQPEEDQVALDGWGKDINLLADVVRTMGCNLAWDQLRASGRSGAAHADALMAFGADDTWRAPLLKAANAMAALTQQQWEACRQWLTEHAGG